MPGRKVHHGAVDYKGQRFGRLEARACDPKNPREGTYWWFVCECGNYVSIRMTNVFTGRTRSCGCLRKEYLGKYRKDLQEFLDMRNALEMALGLVDKSNAEFRMTLDEIDRLGRRGSG